MANARDPIVASARAYLRAVTSGLLVGLPLLVTMEVWEAGATLPPWKLLALFVVAYVIVIGFNALSGFRRDRSRLEVLVDATQAMGLAVIVAALALLVLGRLDPALGRPAIVGRVALEAIPVAFGMALAATVLGGGGAEERERGVGDLGRLLIAAAGALYFALNVAPTDEIRILAAHAGAGLVVLIVLVSLATSLAIVFHAEFRGGRTTAGSGPLGSPLGETIAAYAVSVLVAGLLVWSFGLSDGAGARAIVAQVVVLAFVASFGAAAARLLVGGGNDEAEA